MCSRGDREADMQPHDLEFLISNQPVVCQAWIVFGVLLSNFWPSPIYIFIIFCHFEEEPTSLLAAIFIIIIIVGSKGV